MVNLSTTLLLKENVNNSPDNISEEKYTSSLFIEALSVLKSNMKKYKYLYESANSENLEFIVDRLSDFKNEINRLYSDFIHYINTNQYPKIKEDKIPNTDIIFSEEVCDYINLRISTATNSLNSQLNEEIGILIQAIDKIKRFRSYTQFSEYLKLKEEVRPDKNYFDIIRSESVGCVDEIISKDEFAAKAFEYFRTEKSNIISLDMIDKIKNIDYSFIKKEKQDNIEIASRISNLVGNLDNEVLTFINSNLKDEYKYTIYNILHIFNIRFKEVIDIYLILFAIKLDALKEMHERNINIINFINNEGEI